MFLDGMMGASHIELGCHLWSFCCCFGVLPKLLNVIYYNNGKHCDCKKLCLVGEVVMTFCEDQIHIHNIFIFLFQRKIQ